LHPYPLNRHRLFYTGASQAGGWALFPVPSKKYMKKEIKYNDINRNGAALTHRCNLKSVSKNTLVKENPPALPFLCVTLCASVHLGVLRFCR